MPLRPVSVLPTHSGLGTGTAAVPRARYRESHLRLRPSLPGRQQGSHQPRGQELQGHSGVHQTKMGPATGPRLAGAPGARDGREAPGAPEPGPLESACHTAETPGMFAGQPNGPGSPTAQLVGSAPGPGGKKISQVPKSSAYWSTSKLGMGAPGVQESCYPSCSLPRG